MIVHKAPKKFINITRLCYIGGQGELKRERYPGESADDFLARAYEKGGYTILAEVDKNG